MSERSKKEGPATPPASIPPMRDLEKERKAAIGKQVRSAIEDILTKGGSVSERQLRRWGPDGTEYFFRRLRERINNETQLTVVAALAEQAEAVAQLPPSPAAAVAKQASAPVSTTRDWITHQYHPWPIRVRAFVQGLVLVIALFVAAVVFIRFWPDLTAHIQQQF